jgi:hypothetical protein
MTAKATENCGAKCPNERGGEDFICGRPAGHGGKHDDPHGATWSDGGSERLRQEISHRKECEEGF